MHLRLPGSIDQTIDALKQLVNDADNVLSSWPAMGPRGVHEGKSAYLRWVENASVMIGNYLLDDDLAGGCIEYGLDVFIIDALRTLVSCIDKRRRPMLV